MFTIRNSSTLFVSQKTGHWRYNGLAPEINDYCNGPYPNIEFALSSVAAMRKNGIDQPLTILLTDDLYITEPIVLTNEHKRLTIESFGSRKRIIGGVKLENWKPDTFRGVACLSAPVPKKKDGTDRVFTDLYINGKRASVTRFPATGTLEPVQTEDEFRDGPDHGQDLRGSSRWFIVKKEDLAGLDHIEDAIINYCHWWIDEHSPIESYNPETGKLIMTLNSRFSCSSDSVKKGSDYTRYYLTNVPNTFGAPGQWYLDRASGIIYYIPIDDTITPDTIEAFVPVAEKLFSISGEDIRLRNLELTCTVGDYTSTSAFPKNEGIEVPNGFASDVQSAWNAPAAITFQNAEGGGMFDCHVHGVGIYGAAILQGCNHVLLEDNHIEDICGGGIKIMGGAVNDDKALATTDCILRGNRIHNIGVRYHAGCGILLMHSANNEISNNEIYDTEYTGISAGWVWGYADSTSYRNRIIGNHIHHIGKGNLSDMGGIYILGRNRGTVIAQNRIHDVKDSIYGAWGIYLDEGSSYVTVEENVVYNTKSQCFQIHYGAHNVVRNNILFGVGSPCVSSARDEVHDQVLFENNILITDNARIYRTKYYPAMQAGRNLLWDISKDVPTVAGNDLGIMFDLETWSNDLGKDKGSIIADPKIPGIREFDFTLAEDSPAFKLGFRPLPPKTAKGK